MNSWSTSGLVQSNLIFILKMVELVSLATRKRSSRAMVSTRNDSLPKTNKCTEILKQPLHTTIAIDALEFGEFSVEERLHIVISVKDFKAIISHARVTNTMVKARYSHPSSPMQLTYHEEGMLSEFILMTIGDYRGDSATPSVAASRPVSKRPASRQPLEATSSSKRVNTSDMPPPPPMVSRASTVSREAVIRRDSRPSPPPPQPSVHSQALFFAEEDDDQRWDPQNDEEEEEERLKWDHGGEAVGTIHVTSPHNLITLGIYHSQFRQLSTSRQQTSCGSC